jgi:hypothetical protein
MDGTIGASAPIVRPWNVTCYRSVTMKWLAAAALLTFALTANAQTPPPSPDQADVAIVASAHAREVRFADEPEVHVTVSGDVNGRPAAVVSRTDRTDLPDPVQPHVTYRDIGIRLTITSTLPDIETILDEALGRTTAPPSVAKPSSARKPAVPRKNPKS